MNYVTHKREDGCYQALRDHIEGVAERSAEFARAFDAGEHARRAGLLHDIGKYSPAAQARQRDPEHTSRVDHATAGMQEAMRINDLTAAFAVAGHHGGLPDRGSRGSMNDATLLGRAAKPLTGEMDASAWRGEIALPPGNLLPAWMNSVPPANRGFAAAAYTRMLFSCRVAADYLDPEAFMTGGEVQRGNGTAPAAMLERLRRYVAPWLDSASGALNQRRTEILRRCLRGGEDARGLYTLTIPTGGGKTISSLAFALSHAVRYGLKRVIYVVPYTSIIEQNAQVFRKIVGEENVLEHHANVENEDHEALRLAAENWDAPVVVTTAVQFFESLFAAKPSRCRKLHSIASSVVIFDEAQMLPLPFLRPCVDAIAELVQHDGVTAVLCTATQPSLDRLLHAYAPGLPCKELAPDMEAGDPLFRRVRFQMEGAQEEQEIAARQTEEKQTLCIVNSRRRAQRIFHLLPEEGRFHLSTLMTPEHRSRMLAAIRSRLAAGQPCRVVSTSLVEAGVDLDFPTVWREEAGLDSVLQAAGRCNREGRRPVGQSVVHVFRFDQKPPRMFDKSIKALRMVMDQYEDIASAQAIRAYFDRVMFMCGDEFLDERGILEKSGRLAFREIEEAFRLIDSPTVPVYIPGEGNQAWLAALRNGQISRTILRRLGRSAVNVYPQHFRLLREAGVLECPAGDGCGILIDPRQYDEDCGLALEPECGELWFC